ncbi:MAG: HIT domain-containing protein [Pyrodictiaceae archaeon]
MASHKLDIIFSPWRYQYIKKFSDRTIGDKGCIFCDAVNRSDDEALILLRGRHSFIIMNLYPYNTGHVMIVPYKHVASLEDLDDETMLEISRFTKIALRALREALRPHGFNIGVNIGRVAGAGIEDHVHVHIVPRWNGDANFMPVIAGAKIIPQDVKETYRLLKPVFKKVYREMQG